MYKYKTSHTETGRKIGRCPLSIISLPSTARDQENASSQSLPEEGKGWTTQRTSQLFQVLPEGLAFILPISEH